MTFIRHLFRAICAFTLSISLFLLASLTAFILTLGNPAYIKATLAKSGAYTTFVPAAMQLASAQNNLDTNGTINAQTLTEVTPIVSATATPAFLQKTTETIIDGTFLWLNGTVKIPTFSIKTDELKARLQSQLSTYLQNRIASLPICPKNTNYQNIDPLNASCKPPVTVNQADINNAAADFVDSLPLLQYQEISMQTIDPKGTFTQTRVAIVAPRVYTWLKHAPYILAPIAVACAAALILISHKRSRAWRTVGHTFVWAGVMLTITGGVVLLLEGKFNAQFIGSASQQQIDFVHTVFFPISTLLSKSLAFYSLYFGVGYVFVAVICYSIGHKLRMSNLHSTDNQENIAK